MNVAGDAATAGRERVGVGIRVGAGSRGGAAAGARAGAIIGATAAADERRYVIERDLLDEGSTVSPEIPPFEDENETGNERRRPG